MKERGKLIWALFHPRGLPSWVEDWFDNELVLEPGHQIVKRVFYGVLQAVEVWEE